MLKVLACLLLVSTAFAFEDKTVYQYLVDNGYTMLVSFLQATNQDAVLDGRGPLTVFAPRDDAFVKIDPVLITSMTDVQRNSIVKYHIADGFHLVPQLRMEGFVKSREGQNIVVTDSGSPMMLNNDSMIYPDNDIICTNGVVQPIDTILQPPDLGTINIAQLLITRDDKYRNFFMYLYFANLTQTLEITDFKRSRGKQCGATFDPAGEFTLFAPDDSAWGRIVDKLLHPPNVTQDLQYYSFIEMMKYHIVPGARTTDMLKNGQDIYTLHGYPLNVTIVGDDVYVGHYWSKITEPNIAASNGVIHGMNAVLYPDDLLKILLDALHQQHQRRR